MNAKKLTVLAGTALVALSLACSSLAGVLPGEEPTPTPSPTPVISSSQGSGDSDQESQGDPQSEPGADEDEPQGIIGDSDACLVGTWRADHQSFAGYLEDAFDTNAGDAGLEFSVEAGGGDLLLTFTEDGQMSMQGEDFEVELTIGGLATINVVLDAEGEASYAANGEVIASWDQNYESLGVGSGQVLDMSEVGSTVELTLNPGMLFAYARSGPAELVITGVPDESSRAPYSCQGDTLILGVEDYQPVRWERTSDS